MPGSLTLLSDVPSPEKDSNVEILYNNITSLIKLQVKFRGDRGAADNPGARAVNNPG